MVLCRRCWIGRFVEQSKRNPGWTMVGRPKPQVSRRNSAPIHFSKCGLKTTSQFINFLLWIFKRSIRFIITCFALFILRTRILEESKVFSFNCEILWNSIKKDKKLAFFLIVLQFFKNHSIVFLKIVQCGNMRTYVCSENLLK